MKLRDSNGRETLIHKPELYAIKWDGKCRSKFQSKVREFLRPYWKTHMVFEEFPIPHSRLSIDFFNWTRKVAVEVQGEQHLKYNKFFHGNHRLKYLQQLKRDDKKLEFCERFGIVLVEIYPTDILSEDLFKSFGVSL